MSLNPCSDAILADVAAPGQLLAISHYSHDPISTSMDHAAALKYPITGGTVEEIAALQPDMVVASSFMAPTTRAALMDMGIRVETVGIASSIADSRTQIRELAHASGNVVRGRALIARIDDAVARNTRRGEKPARVVLWQAAGIVPGENTLIGEIMAIGGFTSHSAAMGLGQADYLSLEQMLANPPDVLVQAGRERGQDHPALHMMARKGDVTLARLDPALLYCGGPTIIRALDRMRAIRGGAA